MHTYHILYVVMEVKKALKLENVCVVRKKQLIEVKS